MLPWCLNFNLSLMAITIPSFIQILSTVFDKYFEEFQYGTNDGYFAIENVSVSANLIFCRPDA